MSVYYWISFLRVNEERSKKKNQLILSPIISHFSLLFLFRSIQLQTLSFYLIAPEISPLLT